MDNLIDQATITGNLPTVNELRKGIEPHLHRMEELRRLPDQIVDRLKEIGVFRMLVPQRFGGQELDFPAALEIISRIAAVDGSAGWVASIASGGCLLLPRLPATSLEHVYRHGPDQIIAGSAQAQGKGIRVPGGWRVSGRWPLASGCVGADWILVAFKEGGEEDVKAMLAPAREVAVEDTWRAMGLRGSGSHHISADDVFVADEFVLSLGPGKLTVDGPLYRFPPSLIALMHSAIQIGIAQAALLDIVDLQSQRPPVAAGRLELTHFTLGACDARLKAAKATLERQTRSNWSAVVEGLAPDPERLASTIQMGTHVASETLEIVRRCFELAGSASVYETCPLERRLGDIQVATQHGFIQCANFLVGGKALLENAANNRMRDSVLFDPR